MLGKLNAMLNPLATSIARHVTDAIPVKRITQNTRGGALFLATVESVRVDGNTVAVEVQGYHVATATVALMLCAFLAAFRLIAGPLKRGTGLPPEGNASAPRRRE